MDHYLHDTHHKTWVISTSRRPPSCQQDSLGTPTGLHEVADRIGDGEPEGMVFRAREPTGILYPQWPDEGETAALITSRILRLRGLEPGHNRGDGCDTYNRFVYIHGTNRESGLGAPQSGGCVLLSNREVIELFTLIPKGTLVWIE